MRLGASRVSPLANRQAPREEQGQAGLGLHPQAAHSCSLNAEGVSLFQRLLCTGLGVNSPLGFLTADGFFHTLMHSGTLLQLDEM